MPCSVLEPVSHHRDSDVSTFLKPVSHHRDSDVSTFLIFPQAHRLRIGSANVGTMSGISVAVAEMAGRRKFLLCAGDEMEV